MPYVTTTIIHNIVTKEAYAYSNGIILITIYLIVFKLEAFERRLKSHCIMKRINFFVKSQFTNTIQIMERPKNDLLNLHGLRRIVKEECYEMMSY